jgi:hypothetical protein
MPVAGPSDPSQDQGEGRTSSTLRWLDMRKNLSGHAWTDGQGFVRVRNPKGTIRGCVERSDLNDLFDEGWVLDDAKLE